MRHAVIAFALVGCTFPTKPGDPFACSGTPLPTTAPDTISITLRVLDPLTVQPLAAHITAVSAGVTLLDNVPTDPGGVLTQTIMTGGGPHDVFVQSTVGAPYVDSFAYPPVPVANDIDTPIQQFKGAQLVQLGVTDGMTPAMIVSVIDCNGEPVEGATVTVSGASVLYITKGMPDPTVHATDSTGVAFVLGLTDETPRMVSASLTGVEFISHSVTPHTSSMTIAQISP